MPRKPKNADPSNDDNYIPPATATGKYARDIVQRLGLPEPRPLTDGEKVLQMPENLADVGSHELGSLMTGFSAMQNFADYQAKIMYNDLASQESRLEEVYAASIGTLRGGTITEQKLKAKGLPAVRDATLRAETTRAVYEQVATLRDIYGRCYATVSREIARRQGLVET